MLGRRLMAKVISIHSFRGGTGKSNATANLAALYAIQGLNVGVVDIDIQSPGIHVLFGLPGSEVKHSLNDYLNKVCSIEDVAHNVSNILNDETPGQIFLVPASIKTKDIVTILRQGYDANLLIDGFHQLIRSLSLDILLIDTHPGLKEETLFALAISHALIVVMRPDQQDYEGTGVTIEVARSLQVPQLLLLVNNVPPSFNVDNIKAQVEQNYNCDLGGILPHSEEMMNLASSSLFVTQYPDHPLTVNLQEIITKLAE